MGNGYLPAAGEEPRPARAPKRSLRRGRHLHFDMLGGRNNQNYRGRPTKVCSRTTHYLRRNRRCSFGRTDTLAGKLNASVVVGWPQAQKKKEPRG